MIREEISYLILPTQSKVVAIMEAYVFAIEKRDGVYTVLGNIDNIVLGNANVYIDPIWESIENEARRLSEGTYKTRFINFEATCIEDDPDKGTVVYYDAIKHNGERISNFIPIEKTEEQFLELLTQFQSAIKKNSG